MKSYLCLFVLLAGCSDGKQRCNVPLAGAGIASQQLRDPQTGQCESIDYGYPCDSACGPCPGVAAAAAPAWAQCYGPCEALTETQCLATPSCHAAYQDDGTSLTPPFWGCWEMPPAGPIEGSCANLDAATCSEHDDCVSIYRTATNTTTTAFESCKAEPGLSCNAVDCGAGKLCVVTPAAPSSASCELAAAAGSCTGTIACQQMPPSCPTDTTPGIGANACYTGYCIPTDECAATPCASLTTEAACKARSDCDPIYQGTNCTCDNSGCTCQTETYLRCR
jgi:hypothetical protein